jgi:hypothetical protein
VEPQKNAPAAGSGRFLIGLSDSLFSAPQSDLEKKQLPNPGYFCFNAEGGRFFWRRKNFRMASLAQIKPVLCVFGKLVYSLGCELFSVHHQQARSTS